MRTTKTKAAKQEWPYVTKRKYADGTIRWQVDTRTKNGGERKTYATRDEAERYAANARQLRQNEGSASFGSDELRKYGKTVRHAVDFYLAYLRAQADSIPVAEVIEKFKAANGASWSRRYEQSLNSALRQFHASFADNKIGSITTDELVAWLDGLNVSPLSRNTIRGRIATLFGYAVARKWRAANPFEGRNGGEIPPLKIKALPPKILTPAQAAKIMETASEQTVAFWAVALFAGLRPESEIERLRWEDIDLDQKTLAVHHEGKTSRRIVKMHDNLVAWLRPHAKARGSVTHELPHSTLGNRLREDKRRAGFGKGEKLTPWVQDFARHSFCSYYLAECGDVGVVATQAGNSPEILRKDYLNLVKPAAAAQYWQITPTVEQGKILAMRSA